MDNVMDGTPAGRQDYLQFLGNWGWSDAMCRWIVDVREAHQFFTPDTIEGQCERPMLKRDQVIADIGKAMIVLSKAAEVARKGDSADLGEALLEASLAVDTIYHGDTNNLDEQVFMSNADVMIGKLALTNTEVTESMEAVEAGDVPLFGEEMADAVIRINDICGTMKINIASEVEKKMHKNAARPVKHGKKSNV